MANICSQASDDFTPEGFNSTLYIQREPVMVMEPVTASPPKVLVQRYMYTREAVMVMEPCTPVFAPLSSGAYKVSKNGFILLQFAPAVGVRQYDWHRKQVFSRSITEMGELMRSLGAKETCEFFHDPSFGRRCSRQTKNVDIDIHLPVTKAESAVLMSSFQATALQRSIPIRFILKRELQMMKSTENTITESTHFQARHVNQAAGENVILHPSSPKREYLSNKQDDKLKSAKAEMGEVRQENKNLKRTIIEIMKEYKCLQMNFLDIFEQELPKKSIESDSTNKGDEETEFVSLTLGRSSTHSSTRGDKKKENNSCCGKEQSKFDQALELGLDCRFDSSPTMKNPSPGKSNDDMEEDQEANEKWPPSKSLKSAKTDDNDILQQTPLKKARVSIRAICNAPTMNDGCQWRKYGQKIAKGNPCPRAYYRCTVSPSCPVRKHVQRCAEDRSILVTTYEGTHNHQLPVSATAMASTNSAAASMFKSSSSTSNITNATTFANLHGLNYNSKVPQYSFNFPTTTFSTTQSHPTITLDLTVPTTSSHFNKSSSNFLTSAPRFPPKCLNFASPFSSSSYISNLGRQTLKESYYQPNFMNRNNFQSSSQQPSAETISAATKAFTSNPTFQSALVSAITSFVGKGRSGVQENRVGGENSGHINLGYS